MKTIVGRALTEPVASRFHERMDEIVGFTSDYFNCWRSHTALQLTGETGIRQNAIYAFPEGELSVKVLRTLNIRSTSLRGRFTSFFDQRLMKNIEDESGHPSVKIVVNSIFAGYYLTDLNTMVLSDWTHDRTGVAAFHEMWPLLVMELGLIPLETSSLKKVFPKEITVGCDPEFELIDGDEVIEADDNFTSLDRYDSSIGLDGAGDQIELRPRPGSPIEVTQNMRKLIDRFAKTYTYKLGTAGNTYPLGGHIHVGIGMSWRPNHDLIKLLDDFIGKPTINLSGEARDDYKQLGAVRQQPHGFEYRTCPVAVFQNPAIAVIVLKLARNLVKKYLYENTLVYHDEPTCDDYIEVGGLTKQQAKYFREFCRDFEPTDCLANSWKLHKNDSWHAVSLRFENTWESFPKRMIRDGLAQLRTKVPVKIVLYGLGEKTFGKSACTLPIDGLRHIEVQSKITDEVRVGVSYNIRTGNCSRAIGNALVEALKTRIGGK